MAVIETMEPGTGANPGVGTQAAADIRYDSVTKAFEGITAVDRVTLDIRQGEFFALLGPSGCGKTTLLRLLAGFEVPDQGAITLGGRDLTGVPPHKRPVNTMFQNYALFPHLTVAANIAFGLTYDGLSKTQMRARVAEMLALVRLEGLERRRPDQLSGGQRQRVALARALAKRPKALLLDEPLAALDRKLRESTQSELIRLQRQLGITFVIVTHDQDEAMTLADRMAVMDHGCIVQVGTPREIYEKPNCRYVAEFVGDVNLIEGKLWSEDGRRSLFRAREGLTFAVALLDVPEGTPAWLAIRPERVVISQMPAKVATENEHAGFVMEQTYLGDASVHKVRLADGLVIKVKSVNRAPGETSIKPNDRVWLHFARDAATILLR